MLDVHKDQIMSKLPCAAGAAFDSYDRQHEPRCIPDTRVDLLAQLEEWSKSQDRCIFWLNGWAGTGKSTIARTIAFTLKDRNVLGASFFFSRGVGDLEKAGRFVTTLAHQLARQIPMLGPHIHEAISKNPDVVSQGLRNQWKELILQPLKNSGHQCPRLILVVDALDECDRDEDIRLILQLFIEAKDLNFGVIVTSRPEIPIRLGFRDMPEIVHKDLILQDIPRYIVEHDISVFLKHEFEQIAKEHNLQDWPNPMQTEQVVRASDGLFIYAATVCRFIADPKWLPDERLGLVLRGNDAGGYATAKLDNMYIQVLLSGIASNSSEELAEYSKRFKYLVGSIVVLSNVLHVSALASLLSLSVKEVNATLAPLHALLHIPEDPGLPIRLVHPSFRDFLLDNRRCKEADFWVDEQIIHGELASACLRILSETLKRDLCDLKAPGISVNEIQPGMISRCVSEELRYASHFWVNHLEQASPEQRLEVGLCDGGQISLFFQKHLLHWFEVLCLVGELPECVLMLAKLQIMLQVRITM